MPAPGFGQKGYPQPGYQQPGFQQPTFGQQGYSPGYSQLPPQLALTESTKTPGLAVASLVLGIGSLFVALVPLFGWASIPFALVGLCLGIAGISRANRGFEGKGLAVAGVVTSVLALLLSMMWFLLIIVIGDSVSDTFDQIDTDPRNGVCDESRFLQDPDC